MMQPGRPHRTSSLEALALLAEGEPTERLPVVRIARPAVLPRNIEPVSRNTEPILLPADAIDSRGRFYLASTKMWDGCKPLWEDTLLHVEQLVEEYLDTMGAYPDEICLSFRRYLESVRYMTRRYWPRDMRARGIPYKCESDNVGIYEILVRGKAK